MMDNPADKGPRMKAYGSYATNGKTHRTKRSYKGLKLKKWFVQYFREVADKCSVSPDPNIANNPVEVWKELAQQKPGNQV